MICLLLIEDSEDSMLLIRHALETYGKGQYDLIWADTLMRGIEQLNRRSIDLVLLDLGLPDSSGTVSYAWVREVAPDTPIVVLTGDTCADTEYSVMASGAEEYLIKGQAPGELVIQTIRQALRDRAGHRRRRLSRVTEEWQ